jgi:DNA-binding CsgD family transcriptional regulator
MLEDKDVLPVCEFWAKQYCNRKFEYSELVNIGYVAGKPLNEVKLLQSYIKFAIIKFINKRLKYPSTNNNESIFTSCPCDKVVEHEMNASEAEFNKILDRLENVSAKYENSKLRKHTRQILVWRVVDNMSYVKIAKELNVQPRTVCRYVTNVLQQLRSVVKEREHMLRN